jgi:hypothetical protein
MMRSIVCVRNRLILPALILASLAFACSSDSTGPKTPVIDGTWTGTVSAPHADVTMWLLDAGDGWIAGAAEVTMEPNGSSQGDVSGVQEGMDVSFTIVLGEEGMLAGSLVFEGSYESVNTLTGTLDSGLIQGTKPITFKRGQ